MGEIAKRRGGSAEQASADLNNHVYAVINTHKTETRITPTWIATEVLTKLGAARLQQEMPVVYRAAHLWLRHLARQACRKQFDADDALDQQQQELFPGLQARYPTAHDDGEEPSYVLRESMTGRDVAFNLKRLRREGKTKLSRATALEAWWRANRQRELPFNLKKRGA